MFHAPDEKQTPLARPSVILWVGPKHTGKTTSAARLMEAARAGGFVAAGCLAPSVYANDLLIGFDIVNLGSGERAVLARRETWPGADRKLRFTTGGLVLGNDALGSAATKDADLIIVDEFGPLELMQAGWRSATDRLMTATNAVLLLVVREELAAEVQELYRAVPSRRLRATQPESIAEVLTVLGNNRR